MSYAKPVDGAPVPSVTVVQATAMPAGGEIPSHVPAAIVPGMVPGSVGLDTTELARQAASDFLAEHAWPSGLIETMINGVKTMPYRFIILDDSGSMCAHDGQMLMHPKGGAPKMVSCSRWNELCNAARFHAKFAELVKAPTEFRLLNFGIPIVVGETEDDGRALRMLQERFDSGPRGTTPLVHHITEVTKKIQRMAPELRARGQIVGVTIATDGQSSDGDVANALKGLIGLPVWTVIRLCTNEDRVVNYWNNIDNNIELEMDVLDDLSGECEEVMSSNDWLVYGEPVHRLREFGCICKEMDLLDEALLSPDMMRGVLSMLFGGRKDDYPHPEVDPEGLVQKITVECGRNPPVWSPRAKKMRPWIDINKFKRRYLKGAGCNIM